MAEVLAVNWGGEKVSFFASDGISGFGSSYNSRMFSGVDEMIIGGILVGMLLKGIMLLLLLVVVVDFFFSSLGTLSGILSEESLSVKGFVRGILRCSSCVKERGG